MELELELELEHLSQNNRNTFIEENKSFIYLATYKVCKRTLDWNNDDELSISLIAFNHACETYQSTKGNFYSYARVLIKNALIDYFRKIKNTPLLVFDFDGENVEFIDTKTSLSEFERSLENKNRAEEIALFSKELSVYKLDFNVLINSSPSHIDTRNSLLNLAFSCAGEESIMGYIKEKKLLPVKEITLLTSANRKFIEKWRRYILSLILIISSDEYAYIKSYLNLKVGEKHE
jgi:RNA polymerase sigma factor